MRTKLTPEQERARDERKAKFRALAKQVSNMRPGDRDALAAKMLGAVTCEGRALSVHNTLLLALQLPGATIVGGFRQWLKQGRAVMKGQHGATIWVPKMLGVKTETAENGETVKDGERVGFLTGTVFDVSQTMEVETGKEQK